jgi:hypothetical protein
MPMKCLHHNTVCVCVCVPSKECLSSWGIITVPIRKMQRKVYSLFREDQPVLKKERREWVSRMMW